MNVLRYQLPRQLSNLNGKGDLHNIHKTLYLYQRTCFCCGSLIDEKIQRIFSFSCQTKPVRALASSRFYLGTNYEFELLYIPSNIQRQKSLLPVLKRDFHTTRVNWIEESKVGKTVKILEKKEKEKKVIGGIREVEKLLEKQEKLSKENKPKWQSIKNELKHYYHGFRLLFLDMRVVIRIASGLLRGKTLSRRERKQLVRTTSDLFRLVPLMVFLIIPFMEFLLPFYLKLFPFMLPSTFQTEHKEKVKNLQKLKGKLEMAKFLQDTLKETSVVGKMKDQKQAQEFTEFLQMVRETGKIPKDEDIMNYCSLFEDDITLDTLNHEQLKALCKVLEIVPIGISTILRVQLEMRVRALKADDYAIARDGGVETMAVWELISACRERGMRAFGLSEERLRRQLGQWLHLHLERHIPITLLLITRAMYLPEQLKTEEQLTEFILRMPKEMIDQSELSVAERAVERIDPKKKYDVIKQEQEAIAREKEETKAKEETEKVKEKKMEKEKEKEKEQMELTLESKKIHVDDVSDVDKAPTISGIAGEELVDNAPVVEDLATENIEAKPEAVDFDKEELSVSDLQQLESAIAADINTTALDEEELEDLQEDVAGYETDVRRMEAMAVVRNSDVVESKSAKRLVGQVNKMIGDMTSIVNSMHKEKETLLEEIEVEEVRMRHTRGEDAKRELKEGIASKKEKVVSINDLMLSIRRVQRLPDETRWQKIFEVLDEDDDGKIELHHLMKVLNMLGTDNVKLNPTQMSRLLETIDKETIQERLEMLKKREEVEESSNGNEKPASKNNDNSASSEQENQRDNG